MLGAGLLAKDLCAAPRALGGEEGGGRVVEEWVANRLLLGHRAAAADDDADRANCACVASGDSGGEPEGDPAAADFDTAAAAVRGVDVLILFRERA